MGIGPLNRVSMSAADVPPTGTNDLALQYREVVSAIRGLNGSELLGNRRELRHRRLANGRVVVELVDRETGEVLGELPPGEVVKMAEQLHRE